MEVMTNIRIYEFRPTHCDRYSAGVVGVIWREFKYGL